MKQKLIYEHNHCDMSIRWKLFKNKTSPTPGLFCKCHDVFLDWLPEEVAYELIDVDKIPQEPYTDRKKNKSKPSESKERNPLKARQKKKRKFKQSAKQYQNIFGRTLPK